MTTGQPETSEGPARAPARGAAYWRTAVAPFEQPSLGRGLLDIATSVVPYLALWVAMYLVYDVSYWLVLALAIPASGFLLRTFILFHDCTHGSFFESRRGNVWLGTFTGLLVMTPFENWKHDHAVHHGTSGDLDRRGVGDVQTLTVAEYNAKPWRGRLGYRLFRNPLVMFGIGPLYSLVIAPRFSSRAKRMRLRRSIIVTNVVLALIVGGLCWLIGWQQFLLIQMPMIVLAGTAGVWLFYVQHQFEDAYWQRSDDWSYADAALAGSSYLKLPKVLQFFTGNIGLHHVHHLSARIPNYNLQRAHDELDIFDDVPVLTMWDGLQAVRYKLWDEQSRRMVGFGTARRAREAPLRARPVRT